jgi:hypothetical protein
MVDGEASMKGIVDDWGLRHPAVKAVDLAYLHRVGVDNADTMRSHLERAHSLGGKSAQARNTPPSVGGHPVFE